MRRAADGQSVGVVRTGARAGALAAFLQEAGIETGGSRPQAPRLSALEGDLADSIITLFHGLGGQASEPSLRPGAWDLVVDGSLLVELDEELHFNRYRLATFKPAWTHALPWRDEYLDFCEQMERLCLSAGSWGKRWTTPSCERMFGAADPPGEFESSGAPRWKQRAIYDAIKDAYAAAGRHRVARVSVHDQVGGVSLGAGLEGRACIEPDAVVELIRQRTS